MMFQRIAKGVSKLISLAEAGIFVDPVKPGEITEAQIKYDQETPLDIIFIRNTRRIYSLLTLQAEDHVIDSLKPFLDGKKKTTVVLGPELFTPYTFLGNDPFLVREVLNNYALAGFVDLQPNPVHLFIGGLLFSSTGPNIKVTKNWTDNRRGRGQLGFRLCAKINGPTPLSPIPYYFVGAANLGFKPDIPPETTVYVNDEARESIRIAKGKRDSDWIPYGEFNPQDFDTERVTHRILNI